MISFLRGITVNEIAACEGINSLDLRFVTPVPFTDCYQEISKDMDVYFMEKFLEVRQR